MGDFNWNAQNRTDKHIGHGYGNGYNKHFLNNRNDIKNVLEIGVRPASAMLWTEYFPNASVYGADIKTFDDSPINRFKLFEADMCNKQSLLDIVEEVGTFDIIIDDGPHTSDSQLIGFSTLMEYVNVGGYYVIEDLHCTCPKNDPSLHMKGNSEITMNDYIRDFKNGIYKNYSYINNSEELSKLDLEIFFERGTKIMWPRDGQVEPSEIIFIKRGK